MGNPDLRNAVSHVVYTLKKVTRVVQLAPFAYLLLYSIYLLTDVFFPCNTLYFLDGITSVGPLVCIGILFLGKMLRLCVWFKTACLIPFASKIENCVDCYVIQLTQDEVVLINISLGILSLAFIVTAFRHFYYGR